MSPAPSRRPATPFLFQIFLTLFFKVLIYCIRTHMKEPAMATGLSGYTFWYGWGSRYIMLPKQGPGEIHNTILCMFSQKLDSVFKGDSMGFKSVFHGDYSQKSLFGNVETESEERSEDILHKISHYK